jgi:hypothetical protein
MRYSGVVRGVAATLAQDIFELLSPADAICEVERIVLSQTSEVGDAQEEQIEINIKRGVGTVTSGSGGSAVTPQPREDGQPASGATLEGNNTTKMAAGTGSIELLHVDTWNVRQSKDIVPLEGERWIVSPGNRLTVEMVGAPADSMTLCAYIYWNEIGG